MAPLYELLAFILAPTALKKLGSGGPLNRMAKCPNFKLKSKQNTIERFGVCFRLGSLGYLYIEKSQV